MIGTIQDITQRKLEELAKDEFISVASHQLRTPMSILRWYAEGLSNQQMGALNQKQAAYIQEIAHATNRMVQLTDSLLILSGLALKFDPQHIKFAKSAEVVRSVIRKLTTSAEEKQTHIRLQIAPRLPVAAVDSETIEIITRQIVLNAITYTSPKGHVSIKLFKKGTHVVLQVRDDGMGINPADQTKIFQKFFRSELAREMNPEGTGLGLAIVKQAVERAGGKVWFASVPGKGSTFSVSIPIYSKTPHKSHR